MIRKAALLIARNSWFRKAILGLPVLRDLAGRFVGGKDLASGLATVRGLNARGLKGSLNFHGMHAESIAEAQTAIDQAIDALQAIGADRLDAHVSVKLTKIGFDLDPALAEAGLRRILDCAARTGGFVRLDMEEAVYVEDTLRMFEAMLSQYGPERVGIVIQSYLRHRRQDLDRLMALGASIRLVKGGYREARDVVLHRRVEIDTAFHEDIERLLRQGHAPAIATHDAEAVAWTKTVQKRLGLGQDAFEFQMLLGVKPDLQARLREEGYAVRCYVPYGGDWATHLVGCLRRLPMDLLGAARPHRTKG
ncbi:proline dehydrogenase family protein [Geothrix edaphica]|nr:proline dehydrogenase family protein [Geothrix edaphica]